MRKYTVLVAILVLLASAIAIIYHFAKANYYTGSDIFWYGAIAGFLGCLLLVFLVLIGFLLFKLKTKWGISIQ